MVRFLVLCHAGDRTALLTAVMLRHRHGAEAVRVVTSEELELAPHWSHCVEDGGARSRLRLTCGAALRCDAIGVVFNRLLGTRAPHFGGSDERDRTYASMELYALWMSWLRSLPCPVVNPPSVWGLGTQRRSQAEWLIRAREAGLPVHDYRFTTDPRRDDCRSRVPHRRVSASSGQTQLVPLPRPAVGRWPCVYLQPLEAERSRILVAGERLTGSLAGRDPEALARLRRATGLTLLEVELARAAGAAAGDWRVLSIEPFPHFEDEDRLDGCVSMLQDAEARGRVAG